jgi:HlyD family secretion protein
MKKLIVILLIIGAVAGGWYYFQDQKEDAPQYQATAVSRGDITQAVTATGTLNPVVKVQVGSQISGNIQKLMADFNSQVKKGDVIAQLDPATYQAALNQAEGELTSAEAALKLAELNAQRQRELAKNKISTVAALDQAEIDLLRAQATVKIRAAQVDRARVDLGRCTIYAPIDGVVLSRDVDVGQTVAASLSAPVIFVIANDLRNMQINTSVAEADVGSVEEGQDVKFTVDAFQFRTFRGKVSQVRNNPVTVQNVVTYDTIISATNDDLKLKPGMTANVSIVVAERPNALRVPNAALRFRPPETAAPAPAAKPADAGASRPPEAGGGSGRGERRGPPGGAGRRERGERGGGERSGPVERTIYTLVNGKPEPVQVKLGITDGIFTEVLGGLEEGAQVITGVVSTQAAPAAPPGGNNPFGGSSRRRF